MHEENVRTFQLGTDAINRLDAETAARHTHPNAVFEPRRAETEGAFVGREGMRRFVADTAAMFEVFSVSYTEFRELDDDRFLALGSIRMRGRQSGVESEIPTAAVVEFRDGLLWRYKDYGELRLALAGAAESTAAPSSGEGRAPE